jgi:solute:Na+ symporter, SSS family
VTVRILTLASYFLIVLIIGLIARTRWKSSPESFFLADRKLGTFLLLGTMVATNFSAFTVFGTSGAGYRDGYAFFPIMGFGTGFMALTFWVLGRKIWEIGRSKGVVTPSELINVLYRSPFLSLLFALVMIVFTIPYLALQPMSAGYTLEELLGLPYIYGCILVTAIIVLYTLRGGMRAVVWTDIFQGAFMAVMLLVALGIVAQHHGGFITANQKVLASNPELFSRPGGIGTYAIGIWFSYILLWFFCDPMFPQLFQRFFSARSKRSISQTMIFYPLICTVIFFLPVSVGVLGHLSFPDLAGTQSDKILPMMLTAISGDFMASLILAAGLAALMSTMDSQLLTLSSIFSRDILSLVRKQKSHTSIAGQVFVVVLSLAGLALAYKPPATILQIATQTFSGLAVLFPAVLFGLYFKRVYSMAAILSIICGEGTLLIFYVGWLPAGAFLPVIWVMLVTFTVYLATHVVMLRRDGLLTFQPPKWLKNPYLYLMAGIFVLATDFWNWGAVQPVLLGIPSWLWYFALLSAIQTIVMLRMVKSEAHADSRL